MIYSLSERGYDADLGKWIAETIPEMIEPRSWKEAGTLRYYAPKNILVVNHSSAVHAKIDRFLQEVKTSLPKGNKSGFARSNKAPTDAVIPASYRQLAGPPEPSAYPVPAPVKVPKHLFHFLIRYEGEGIIDDNVVKYMKVQNQGEKKETSVAPTASTPDSATVPQVSSAPVSGYSTSSSVMPSTSYAGGSSGSSSSMGSPAPKDAGTPQPTSAATKSADPNVATPAPKEVATPVPSATVPYRAVR